MTSKPPKTAADASGVPHLERLAETRLLVAQALSAEQHRRARRPSMIVTSANRNFKKVIVYFCIRSKGQEGDHVLSYQVKGSRSWSRLGNGSTSSRRSFPKVLFSSLISTARCFHWSMALALRRALLQQTRKESGPLNVDFCDHIFNSQPVKRSAGGNSLNVNSILERLGRPMTLNRTKGSSEPIKTGMMLLEPPKLLHTIRSHEQANQVEAPAHRIDEAQPMLLDPPITVEQLPTVELDEPGNGVALVHEFDKQQQEKMLSKSEAKLILSEPPKLLTPIINLDKVDDEGQAPEQELEEQQQKRTHSKSGAQLTLLEPPKLASDSNKKEAHASKADEQQQEQTQVISELQLMLPESPKLSRQMPTIRLDEPDNGREAPANDADEQQQKNTHSNLEAQMKLPEPPKLLDDCNDEGQSSAQEADKQQPDETHTNSGLQMGLMQEHERNIFTSAGSSSCHEAVPSTDAPPSLSRTDYGEEGLPLEVAAESMPESSISERNLTVGKTSSGLDAQLKSSPSPLTEPKSSKKKAFVPTPANECLCNMPPYGYMVNCRMCGTHFHAACIQLEGIKPGEGYTCASCKEQPNRKRRQAQVTRLTMESKERT